MVISYVKTFNRLLLQAFYLLALWIDAHGYYPPMLGSHGSTLTFHRKFLNREGDLSASADQRRGALHQSPFGLVVSCESFDTKPLSWIVFSCHLPTPELLSEPGT
jgi:hypothetical protein